MLEPQRVAANIAQLRHGDSLIVTGNLGGQAIGAVLQQVAARALLRVHKVRFRCPNCGLQRASIEAAVKSLLARTGNKLDAVLHNAGVAAAGVFEDVPESELRRVMETNFFGILGLTRALLPTFRAQRNGRIVVVSSEAAFIGQPTNSIYCASKWAIEGWAEAIAYELEPFGIELILIEPGPYRTEIWKSTPRIQPQGSPYHAWVQQVFRAGDAHAASMARDPNEVALVVACALEARRPRFRYPVGPFARLNHFLRGKVPSRLLRKAGRDLGFVSRCRASLVARIDTTSIVINFIPIRAISSQNVRSDGRRG